MDKIVAIIPKADRQQLRLEFEDFRNARYCVIRVWFKRQDGTWRPGREGLNLKVDLLQEVTDALTKAIAMARDLEHSEGAK